MEAEEAPDGGVGRLVQPSMTRTSTLGQECGRGHGWAGEDGGDDDEQDTTTGERTGLLRVTGTLGGSVHRGLCLWGCWGSRWRLRAWCAGLGAWRSGLGAWPQPAGWADSDLQGRLDPG